jgi:hypothetical protein
LNLKTILRLGINKSVNYGSLVYKLFGNINFSSVFTKIAKRFIKRGYDPIIFRTPHAWNSTLLQLDATLSSFDGQFLKASGLVLVGDFLVALPSFRALSAFVIIYLHDHLYVLFISSYKTMAIVRISLGWIHFIYISSHRNIFWC